MMYPFMTLDDDSEIVHSKMKEDGRVKVYIEKPDARDCFHHAACWLPGYDWEDISGFTEEEIARYDDILKSTAHLIIRFSQEGGLENASGFKVGSYWVFFWANESKPLEPIHVQIRRVHRMSMRQRSGLHPVESA